MKKILVSVVISLFVISCSSSNDSLEDPVDKSSLQAMTKTVTTRDGKTITADKIEIDEKTGFVKASGKNVVINLNPKSNSKHHGCRFIIDLDTYIDWVGPGQSGRFCGIGIDISQGGVTIQFGDGSTHSTGTLELDGLDPCTLEGLEDLVDADPTNSMQIICE